MADQNASSTSATGGKGINKSYNPAAGYLNAEARRTLTSPIFGVGTGNTRVPTDTVLKRMLIKLSLVTQVTYSSGSPLTSYQGVFDRICNRVEVNVNGNRIIKSVRPHLQRLHNMLIADAIPRRSVQIGSAAPTNTRAAFEWLSGQVAYPVTTHYISFQEAIELNFENPWGYGGSRSVSELDIRDAASCDLNFYWNAVTNIQGDASSQATVTYANSVVTVTPMIIENRARLRPDAGDTLFDYVETSFSRTYTGQANNQQIDLQTGNFLMGLGVYVNNGDGALTPQENLLSQMSLQINGATAIQGPLAHQDLQDENVLRFGCEDSMGLGAIDSANANAVVTSAGYHPLQGFGMMNLVRNGDWNTAINTSRQAGVDSIKLQFNTASSSGTDNATYTNPLAVTVHTHEIRPYAFTR